MTFRRPDRSRKTRAKKSRRFPFFVSSAATIPLERRRRFTIEPLEDRALLTVYTVDLTTDNVANTGQSTGPTSGDLRWCVNQADQDGQTDTITFDPSVFGSGPVTIDLNHGQIEIAASLTIVGPGATSLTIDQTTTNGARVFQVDATDANNNPVNASMSGLTLTGGNAVGSSGGGIWNLGSLSLNAMALSSNFATAGAAIYDGDFSNPADHASLTVTNSTLSGNTAFGNGGAVGVSSSSATITNSTLAGNESHSEGGGIYVGPGSNVNLSHSTLSSNTADNNGGGIENIATLTIGDSTISSNSTNGDGGGIDNDFLSLVVSDSTISNNSANTGGGVSNRLGSADLANTIVAGNGATGSDPDVSGSFATTDHNLIGEVGNASGFSDNGNFIASTDDAGSLGLGPLANNGGPTQTIALLSGSPAIGAGDLSPPSPFPPNPSTDQRGFPRTNAGTIDIGAYETQSTNFQLTAGGTYMLEVAPAASNVIGVELLDSQGNVLDEWPLTTPSLTITNASGQPVQLIIDSSNGAVPMPITFDGGTGDGSSLVLQGVPTGGSVTNHTYSPGPGTGQGTDTAKINGVTETVNFVNLTPVYDSLPGNLTVDGTNGDDAINYAEGNDTTATPNTAWGQVSVNNLEAINFTGQTMLSINGLAGNDSFTFNNSFTPTGLTDITAFGGDGNDQFLVDKQTPTSPNLHVQGGNNSNTLTVPSALNGPTVWNVTGANAGSLTGLNVDFFAIQNLVGPGTYTIGLAGSLSGSIDGLNDAKDNVLVGDNFGDVFSITGPDSGTLITGVVQDVPIFHNIGNLTGGSGDDTFNFLDGGSLSSTIDGGGGNNTIVGNSAGDSFIVSGANAGTITGLLGPGGFSNIQILAGGAGDDTFTFATGGSLDGSIDGGGSGPTGNTLVGNNDGDSFNVTGANSGTLFDGAANLVAGGWGNIQNLQGGDGNDSFTVTAGGSLDGSAQGGAGDDTFSIGDGVGTPIVLGGGPGSNTLYASSAVDFGTFSVYPGASSDAGSMSTPDNNGSNLNNITFTGIQTIQLTDTGTRGILQVYGTGGNDVFTQGEGAGVTVNAGPFISFNPDDGNSGFSFVNLYGGGGKDRYDVNPSGLGVRTELSVFSDALASGSTLSVTAAGQHDALTVVPIAAGIGYVTDYTGQTAVGGQVNYSGIAGIELVGLTGDNDLANVYGTEGDDTLTYSPGTDGGSGTVTGTLDFNDITFNGPFALPTVTFSQMSPTGPVGLFGDQSGGNDTAIVQGTASADTFTVDASTNTVTVNNVAVTTGGNITTPNLVLDGLAGDNTYKIDATKGNGYTNSITVNGSGLSDPDSLTLLGDGVDAATVTLNADGTADVSGGGLGAVHVTGVANLTVDNSAGAGAAVTVVDNATNNTFDVTPTGTNSATEQIEGQPLVVHTVSAGNLNATLVPNGNDKLIVNGSQYDDVMNVSDALVTDTEMSGPAATLQSVALSGEASLTVNGNDGSDTFNVTPSATVPIFVDGGNPVGVLPGDQFNLVSGGGAVTFTAGPTSDSGGFEVGNDASVSFSHIETIGTMGTSGVTVNGTNGDDQITIIARDSSYNAAADGVQDFTISVNGGPDILFINTPTLNVNALSGNDDIVVETPAPDNAVWNVQVTIDGGPPTTNGGGLGDVFALETPAGSNAQNVTYTPTGANSGSFNDTTLTSLITLTNVEQAFYNGGAANDTLSVTATAAVAAFVYTPGATVDAAIVAVGSLLPLNFANLGTPPAVTLNDAGGGGTLVYNGMAANDYFKVSANATNGQVLLQNSQAVNTQLPVDTKGISGLTLNDVAGENNYIINGPVSAQYATINVDGSGLSDPDVLTLTGDDSSGAIVNLSNQTISGDGLGTVSFTGVGTVNFNAGGAAVTVIDSNGSTNLALTPTATGASIQTAGSPLINVLNAVASPLTVILPGGGNTLTVNGSAGNDVITVTNSLVTIGGDLPIAYTPANLAALDINGLAGNDTLTVDSSGGPITAPIYYDGGTGSNSLVLTGGTAISDVYGPGPLPGQGTDTLNFGTLVTPLLETVQFTSLTPVIDNVAGPLTVDGTTANDAITAGATANVVTVNNLESISFANKSSLTLNGLAGNDTFNVTPTNITLTGLAPAIDVNGTVGANDLVTVNGATGVNPIAYNPSGPGGATVTVGAAPTVTIADASAVAINGQAGNNALTITSPIPSEISFTAGAVVDSGSVTMQSLVSNVSYLPLQFSNLGSGAGLSFVDAGGGRVDGLDVHGTNSDNLFNVSTTGVVQIVKPIGFIPLTLPISTTGATELRLIGGDGGNDTFSVPGNHPFTFGLQVQGDAGGNNTLNFTGDGTAPVAVDLAAGTVDETGFSPVGWTDVGTVNVNAGGATLTITDANANTDLNVTPTDTNAGTAQATGTPIVNFSSVASFTVDLPNGTQVNVHSPSPGATFVADEPTRTIYLTKADGTKLIPVVLNNDVQIVELDSLIGNNTFLVVPSPAVLEPGKTDVVGQPNFQVPDNLLVNVVGGGAAVQNAFIVANYDPITGQSSPLDASLFAVDNRTSNTSGIVRMFQSNGLASEPTQYPDITYTNVSIVSPNTVTNAATHDQQTLTIGPDLYDPNASRNNAAYLGSGATINATNLAIFPNAFEHEFLQAEQDWFRVVAQSTGTMDFQVYFNQYAGFLPGNGQLQIQVYDAAGNEITHFGVNDQTSDERRRIPVVAGETYYLQVYGISQTAPANDTFDPANATVNGYSITIVNTPAPAPNAIGLNDVVAQGMVSNAVAPTATTFTANSAPTPPPVIPPNFQTQPLPPLSTLDNFYIGMYLEFTSGPLVGQRQLISGYIAATRTFTFASPFSQAPDVTDTFQIESDDTGRSQLDNVTRNNKPTVYIRLDAANTPGDGLIDLQGGGNSSQTPPNNVPILIPFWAGNAATAPYSPANNGSYRIAVYDETNPQSPIFLGYANAVSGQNGVFQLQVKTPLAEGSHNLVAKVEFDSPIKPSNHDVGAGVALSIVVDTQAPPVYFGSPTVPNSGLQGASDTGVAGQPATINDRITAASTPTFYGVAEANAVVKLYVDMNGNGKVDNGDIFIGQTTATPIDGSNQDPNGQWTVTSSIDLNNPAFGFPHDGVRTILATGEDLAGNVSAAQNLKIFLDTQGPQVGNVTVTGNPNYNLFLNKPNQPTPTPLVNALDVTFNDQPVRLGPDFVYPAVNPTLATTIADYQLVGKNNGPVQITSITLVDSTTSGTPGKTVVTLHFAAPLADDQYTLSVSDKIEDNAGNPLDGEFNGTSFPSGNNSPAGVFNGTFVVNSHPHLAVYSGGSVSLDINGNGKFDPSNTVIDSDLVETFGYASDRLFDGNFANTNGFDELGAYGFVNNQWRWLLNLNPAAGTSNPTTFIEPFAIDGAPVAGYFAGNTALGMQVGLFDGTTWYLDVLNHHTFDAADIAAGGQLTGDMRGYPIVGDFDGDGKVDLGTYQNGVFEFDLSSREPGGKLTGNYNATISVQSVIPDNIGFSEVLAQPVAADIDGDGITDLGLYVPDRTENAPYGQAEWYWLVSNDANDAGGVNPSGAFASLNHPFNPTPLGHDLYYEFGNQFAIPLVGIWDPPSSDASTTSPPSNTTASDPTSGWVAGLYETVLGRQPSSDEVANWAKVIGTGQITAQQVAQDFLESPERLATIINGLYEQYLGRAADTAGINYWVGIWQAGGGEEQVQAGIISSVEYYATAGKLYANLSADAAWVTALYNNILGRAPDSQGLDFWTNALKTETRASIVLGFVTSNEYRLTLINGWFEEYLGRALDPSGAQYWLQQMQLGLTQDALQSGILGSAEFKAKFSGSGS